MKRISFASRAFLLLSLAAVALLLWLGPPPEAGPVKKTFTVDGSTVLKRLERCTMLFDLDAMKPEAEKDSSEFREKNVAAIEVRCGNVSPRLDFTNLKVLSPASLSDGGDWEPRYGRKEEEILASNPTLELLSRSGKKYRVRFTDFAPSDDDRSHIALEATNLSTSVSKTWTVDQKSLRYDPYKGAMVFNLDKMETHPILEGRPKRLPFAALWVEPGDPEFDLINLRFTAPKELAGDPEDFGGDIPKEMIKSGAAFSLVSNSNQAYQLTLDDVKRGRRGEAKITFTVTKL